MISRLESAGLCLLVLYFAFHAFAGEQGLGKWSDAQAELSEKQREYNDIRKDIELLRADIARLTPGSVDPDFVEALARDKLAFVYPHEYVLILPNESSAE